MRDRERHEQELREAIGEGRAVIVAGTGVSIAASRDAKGETHPQASWAGLLKHGLEWLLEHKLIADKKAAAHLTLLEDGAETHGFISAAQAVMAGMGGPASKHFHEWLEATVGAIRARDRSVIDALHALREQGNLLATTNYDDVLLAERNGLESVTWIDPPAFLGAIRRRDRDKVLFLHGHWRRPDSVILDWNSYHAIARDERYRQDLEAVWKTATWVYVGCGTGGLGDPDFGLLLERYGKRARDARLWDYCLVTDGQRAAFQAEFEKRSVNIRALSFGTAHDRLAPFLRSLLPASAAEPVVAAPAAPAARNATAPAIPSQPALYAEPAYIASHAFVGRDAELHVLDDWAAPADPTNLLLFEAIGGNGKSMLTWEWATRSAPNLRTDWAGRFWYSFYEHGAVMADFCQRALAYMTGVPLEALRKKKTLELREPLLALLRARPWLLILDGLERVLVAYHRIDAAEVPDEEANQPTDKIVSRDPCDTIRDEDGDLLRSLAGAARSKVLATSRLTPRVLLNAAGQPIPGAKRLPLAGLRPPDAEKLFRSCGIEGDSAAIQQYLSANCDNHPLVIGILAGLINDYLPRRGNFDAWATATDGGGQLDFGQLDLIQRRNHILRAALAALSGESGELLATLSLLPDSVDFETLSALNPYQGSDASRVLADAVKDLERRGLLQYDRRIRRYDLHPVVRAVAAGGLKEEDKTKHGQRIVDHFSSRPHRPYEEAETLDDVRVGMNLVRTLLKLGRFDEAAEVYQGDLSRALIINIEAGSEALAMLRPFFPGGWDVAPALERKQVSAYLANDVGKLLHAVGQSNEAISAYGTDIRLVLELEDWWNLTIPIANTADALMAQGRIADAHRLKCLCRDFAVEHDDSELLFLLRLDLFTDFVRMGKWHQAEVEWNEFYPMGRAWSRAVYRPGDAEALYARYQFYKGSLKEEHLGVAERLAREGTNRFTIRDLLGLRGAWRTTLREWEAAASSFQEAVRLARERGRTDRASESGLALAKFQLGQLAEPCLEAERLTRGSDRLVQPYLAMLWRAIGDHERAAEAALAAYRAAWADGEPYVHRYWLTKGTELLTEWGVPIPQLPAYDPAKAEKFPWEDDVVAVIEKLQAEKAKKEAEGAAGA